MLQYNMMLSCDFKEVFHFQFLFCLLDAVGAGIDELCLFST